MILILAMLHIKHTVVMKTKLVLWATNEKEEKTLLAYQLRAEDNIVDLWSFSGENATNDVHRSLMYEWREGKEMAFPSAGYEHHEMELSVSTSLLPEGYKVEKDDLITRAQTEWHFVVLSEKLNHSYLSELEDMEEKVNVTDSFQPNLWEELVGFWDKVQSQVRERNLSRDHANILRDKTNNLFAVLKELRKKLDEEFKEQAKVVFDKLVGIIDNLDKKMESGGNLAALFNELKDIQNESREAKLTKDLRIKLRSRIDSSFKVVKEKRFGPEGASGNSPLERIERRYQGLLKAINRMEHSIQRDEKDLNFQTSKMNSVDAGQLETQLREAKMKVIQVQVDSKKEKLANMHTTREQLEKQLEREKAKAKKAAPAEKKEAKSTDKAPSDTKHEAKKDAAKQETAAPEAKGKKEAAKVKEETKKVEAEVKEEAKAKKEVAAEKPEVKEEAVKVEAEVKEKVKAKKEGTKMAEAKGKKEVKKAKEEVKKVEADAKEEVEVKKEAKKVETTEQPEGRATEVEKVKEDLPEDTEA